MVLILSNKELKHVALANTKPLSFGNTIQMVIPYKLVFNQEKTLVLNLLWRSLAMSGKNPLIKNISENQCFDKSILKLVKPF